MTDGQHTFGGKEPARAANNVSPRVYGEENREHGAREDDADDDDDADFNGEDDANQEFRRMAGQIARDEIMFAMLP